MGRRGKPIKINGVIYPSLKDAAIAHDTDPDTLQRRLLRAAAPNEPRRASPLTPDQAADIRASHERASVLAQRFGVSRQTIYNIRSGKTWDTE